MKKLSLPISNIMRFEFNFITDQPEEVRMVSKGIEHHKLCHRSLKMYHLRSIQNVPPMSPFVSCL